MTGHCVCGRNEWQCSPDWPCCMDCPHAQPAEPRAYRLLTTEERLLVVAALDCEPDIEPAADLPATPALSPYLTDPLLRELIPQRLPRAYCGDGPTALLMALERQRALWAGEFNDTPTLPSTTKEAANG